MAPVRKKLNEEKDSEQPLAKCTLGAYHGLREIPAIAVTAEINRCIFASARYDRCEVCADADCEFLVFKIPDVRRPVSAVAYNLSRINGDEALGAYFGIGATTQKAIAEERSDHSHLSSCRNLSIYQSKDDLAKIIGRWALQDK